MLNPVNLLSKFFKSSNQRELDKLTGVLTKINELESKISALKDSEFPIKTEELKKELKKVSI